MLYVQSKIQLTILIIKISVDVYKLIHMYKVYDINSICTVQFKTQTFISGLAQIVENNVDSKR